MKLRMVFCAAIMLATLGLAARAEGLDPIAMRQTGMDLESGSFAFIRAVIAAKGDVKSLESPAKAIRRWTTVMVTLFPPGSDKGDTRALPEIWSDRAGFEKMAATLAAATDKLAVAARAGDLDAADAASKEIGTQCGACHRAYRAR